MAQKVNRNAGRSANFGVAARLGMALTVDWWVISRVRLVGWRHRCYRLDQPNTINRMKWLWGTVNSHGME